MRLDNRSRTIAVAGEAISSEQGKSSLKEWYESTGGVVAIEGSGLTVTYPNREMAEKVRGLHHLNRVSYDLELTYRPCPWGRRMFPIWWEGCTRHGILQCPLGTGMRMAPAPPRTIQGKMLRWWKINDGVIWMKKISGTFEKQFANRLDKVTSCIEYACAIAAAARV